MMNGTVMGPVVTPPESECHGQERVGHNERRQSEYHNVEADEQPRRFHPNRMRRNDTTRKNPTPAATVKMSTRSGTAGVWRASTCRSGSATVMITPITNEMLQR